MQSLPHKPAITDYPIHPLLAERWSTRSFADQSIPPEVLGSLMEAARWSPSSSNNQPWRFVVTSREETDDFAAMVKVLGESNQKWAYRASLLLVGIAAKLTPRGTPNAYGWYDLGQSVAHLSIQATALGLHLRQMGGFDKDQARTLLQIPDDFDPVVAIAIGYQSTSDHLPADIQERELAPRVRQPLSEMLFYRRWGNTVADQS